MADYIVEIRERDSSSYYIVSEEPGGQIMVLDKKSARIEATKYLKDGIQARFRSLTRREKKALKNSLKSE